MNRKLGCALICLGLVAGGGVAGNVYAEDKVDANAAAKKPSIKFEDPQFNFGSVVKGDMVTHEFKFKNVGTDVLKINKVNTSCGCTAAVTSAQEIQPGGEGTIRATFNSGNFQGQITKNIFVETNDPDQPQIRLGLTGNIEVEVVTSPPLQIFFGMVEQGQPAARTLNIKQGGQRELVVSKVETDLPFITTKLIPENTGSQKSYNVELSLNPDAPQGRFEGRVKAYTNIPGYEIIDRQIVGIVKPKADAAAEPAPDKK